MEEVIHYRPSQALSWLDEAAEVHLRSAGRHTKEAIRIPSDGEFHIKSRVKSAGKALFQLGRSAYSEISAKRNEMAEYLLSDVSITQVNGSKSISINNDDVKEIRVDEHGFEIVFEGGSISIHPYAFVVSGLAKAPIGWERNGHEVRFELLIDEISARTGVPIQ